jgi:hypothetical protein
MPVAENAALSAQFDIGNSSLVRKRISVLLIDSDFSDISVCTFWLAPQSPLRTFTMQTRSTKPWTNAAIYFYAATPGTDGGAYRLDKVSLHAGPVGSASGTECGAPGVPIVNGEPNGPELLVNGNFSNGLTAWSTFHNIVYAPNDTSFYFYRPPDSLLPPGGILQETHTALTDGQVLTAEFKLANTSNVRKRVTVIIHDADFSDLSACTFWVAPGQLMSASNVYSIRMFATKPWTNAYISFYAATPGYETWTGIDDVSLRSTPGAPTTGTNCNEPG